MARYVCDFDSIDQTCNNLNSLADELDHQIETSSRELTSELSSWSGDSSTEFQTTNRTLTNKTKEDSDSIRAYSAYLKEVSTTIQEAEDALSQLKI